MAKKWWLGIILGGIVLLAAASYLWWRGRADDAVRASGIVEGVEVQITSKVAGRIATLCCREGETVRAGEVVVRLESDDLAAAVEQTAAEIASAEAEVRRALA